MKTLFVIFLLFISTNSFSQSHGNKENKLVEFHHSGSWEIWCIQLGSSKKIECNLNHVLRYKDHPDFRAMIPRVFWRNDKLSMVWGAEWQTSLHRAVIKTDDGQTIEFSGCGRPCVLASNWVTRLQQLAAQESDVTINFHDYWVEEFTESLPLDGFVDGIELLKSTQQKFN